MKSLVTFKLSEITKLWDYLPFSKIFKPWPIKKQLLTKLSFVYQKPTNSIKTAIRENVGQAKGTAPVSRAKLSSFENWPTPRSRKLSPEKVRNVSRSWFSPRWWSCWKREKKWDNFSQILTRLELKWALVHARARRSGPIIEPILEVEWAFAQA